MRTPCLQHDKFRDDCADCRSRDLDAGPAKPSPVITRDIKGRVGLAAPDQLPFVDERPGRWDAQLWALPTAEIRCLSRQGAYAVISVIPKGDDKVQRYLLSAGGSEELAASLSDCFPDRIFTAMTRQSSDMVEWVARAMCAADGLPPSEVETDWWVCEDDARTALEASHHAELVEALRSAGSALDRIALIANEGSAIRLQAEAELGSVSRALAKVSCANTPADIRATTAPLAQPQKLSRKIDGDA